MQNISTSVTSYLLLLAFCAGAEAAPIVIGDQEWRQLNETLNYSWDEVATVCDPATGICNGSLGSVDFTGWIWASVQDTGNLFATLTPHSGDISRYDEQGSDWAPNFLTLFDATFTNTTVEVVAGTVRTAFFDRFSVHRSYAPRIIDTLGSTEFDFATNNLDTPTSHRGSAVGVWLYRDAASVPEPSTVLLFGIGLAGMGLARRKRKI